jgi:hypothetical protein
MSTLPKQKQISILQSKAKEVLTREAFKHVVWVGVLYSSHTLSSRPKPLPLDLVIFHDPKYSEEQIWNLYGSCGEVPWEDPDQSKFERAWNQKVNISKNFEGNFRYWNDVEATFYAETLYGHYNQPALQNLRSVYYQNVKECLKNLSESVELVRNLRMAKGGLQGSEHTGSQCVCPLRGLVQTPWEYADELREIGRDDPLWPQYLLSRGILGPFVRSPLGGEAKARNLTQFSDVNY